MLVFRIEQFVHPCTEISGNANQRLFTCRHRCRRGHMLQARPGRQDNSPLAEILLRHDDQALCEQASRGLLGKPGVQCGFCRFLVGPVAEVLPDSAPVLNVSGGPGRRRGNIGGRPICRPR